MAPAFIAEHPVLAGTGIRPGPAKAAWHDYPDRIDKARREIRASVSKVAVGTQGWSFDNWAGTFYPKGLPPGERLAWYSRTFNGVEVNTSFHAVPPVSAVRHWRESTPEGFSFAIKMPRAITHDGRLRNTESELAGFLKVAVELKEKLGPILVQLPPSFGAADLPALDRFLRTLPVHEMRFCVEVRRPALRSPGVRDLLRRRSVGLVTTNLTSEPGDLDIVDGIAYLRLLGSRQMPGQPVNASGAPSEELDLDAFKRQSGSWAATLRLLLPSSGSEGASSPASVFCFVSNDYFGPGFLPAAYLIKQLGLPVHLPPGSFLDMPVQGTLL
ncbi:MAG: DUF72 domain-containing protein [Chloroflexi bacterium]|nr:DUF72 domain-containing protein [Chloroflexota bacterium]